jgi:hypothetical protein
MLTNIRAQIRRIFFISHQIQVEIFKIYSSQVGKPEKIFLVTLHYENTANVDTRLEHN